MNIEAITHILKRCIQLLKIKNKKWNHESKK
jgi:hypothetical protein